MSSARRGADPPRLLVEVVAALERVGYVVFRIVPEGETRRERALTVTRAGLAEPADLQVRQSIFSSVGYSGVLIGAVVFGFGGLFLGMASDMLGFVPWGSDDVFNLTSGPFGFFCGVGAAAALRARMVQRALTLWTKAGRPEGWRTPRSARPGNRDLVYWLVCGVLLGWLMWASSDVQRADHETWAVTGLAASEFGFGDTVTFGGTAAIGELRNGDQPTAVSGAGRVWAGVGAAPGTFVRSGTWWSQLGRGSSLAGTTTGMASVGPWASYHLYDLCTSGRR